VLLLEVRVPRSARHTRRGFVYRHVVDADLDARADAIWERAREVAELPHPVARLDDPWARNVVERFSRVFPKMLLIGDMIEAALAEALQP
jgi:hypothetical protein